MLYWKLIRNVSLGILIFMCLVIVYEMTFGKASIDSIFIKHWYFMLFAVFSIIGLIWSYINLNEDETIRKREFASIFEYKKEKPGLIKIYINHEDLVQMFEGQKDSADILYQNGRGSVKIGEAFVNEGNMEVNFWSEKVL